MSYGRKGVLSGLVALCIAACTPPAPAVQTGSPAAPVAAPIPTQTPAPTPAPIPSDGLGNGDFEVGTLAGWTVTGSADAATGAAYDGSYAASVGGPAARVSSLAQAFHLPVDATTLQLWYRLSCAAPADLATASVSLTDAGGAAQLLPPFAADCSKGGDWREVILGVEGFAGQHVALTLSLDEGNDQTWSDSALFDSVVVFESSPGTVTPVPIPVASPAPPPSCQSDSDCGDGLACSAGSCVAAPPDDSPAPPPADCGDDCAPADPCADGSCAPPPPPPDDCGDGDSTCLRPAPKPVPARRPNERPPVVAAAR